MASPAPPLRGAPLRQDALASQPAAAAAAEEGAGPDISASLVAPPRWFLLLRDAPASQHAAAAEVEGEGPDPEVTASLVAPPGVSILAVPAALHPDPLECDLPPYVVAADPAAGLLLHIARWPMVGFDLDASPDRTGCLLVVRGFVPTAAAAANASQGVASSAVLRVPDRPEPPAMAPISSVKCLGLVSLPGSGGADYVVAELRVDAGIPHAKLLYFRHGADEWAEKDMPRPDVPGRTSLYWGWDPDSVVAHDGKLWWVNLQRGLVWCDPFDEQPMLRHIDFPETIAEELKHSSTDRDIEFERCVGVSRGRLRYVEITRAAMDRVGATMVILWTLFAGTSDGQTWWKCNYGFMLAELWSSSSYKATRMPEDVPVLATISPSNPHVIYFFLKQYIFSADVQECMVLSVKDCGLLQVRGSLRSPPISWRYVLAWELPVFESEGPETMPCRHGKELLIIRSEAAQLRRSEYALKKHEQFVLSHEDALKKLEEGLLQVVSKPKDDLSWNKIQIVLYGVLVTGLTVLAQFWPWMPSGVLQAVPIAFATVWVLGCIALPFALFGAKKWEIGFSHHAARTAFLCFSTFVLYGLYRMSVDPTSASSHSGTPTASHPVSHGWGWMEYIYIVLELVSLIGQVISWIVDWRRSDTDP
ncbi:unnamed protein product [Urochloa humidicola]